MNHYQQLNQEQRYQIYALKSTGLNQTQIAKTVGVHKSTIQRELIRNKGKRAWRPVQAQQLSNGRRVTNATKFNTQHWVEVDRLIGLDMSPVQASERLKLEGVMRISHETIYQHLYADKRHGGELWKHLKCQKLRRKRYGSGQWRRGMIPNRTGIEDRPDIVTQKTRIGDWEGDTVIGAKQRGALVTLAERKSAMYWQLLCQASIRRG